MHKQRLVGKAGIGHQSQTLGPIREARKTVVFKQPGIQATRGLNTALQKTKHFFFACRNFRTSTSKSDIAFTKVGFSTWSKAIENSCRFKAHDAYLRFLNDEGRIQGRFYDLTRLKETDAQTIVNEGVLPTIEKLASSASLLVLGADGASVISGCYEGVAAKLKRSYPWLLYISSFP